MVRLQHQICLWTVCTTATDAFACRHRHRHRVCSLLPHLGSSFKKPESSSKPALRKVAWIAEDTEGLITPLVRVEKKDGVRG